MGRWTLLCTAGQQSLVPIFKSKDYEMDGNLDASKANREPFGTLIIYIAPVIPIAMFAATIWIDLSV